MNRFLKPTLKALFVFGLLYFLVKKGFISVELTRQAFGHWQLMTAGLLLFGFNFFLGAVRWHWLLQAHGLRLRFLRTLELTLVGNFFNIALPGAVSGDFVKAFYVGKDIGGKRSQAFGSILFDRVAGLSALVFVSGVAMTAGYSSFISSGVGVGVIRALRPFLVTSVLVVVAFYSYLFLVRDHHDPVLRVMRRLEKTLPKLHALTQIYLGLRYYHHHRGTVLKVFILSVFIHTLVGLSLLLFAGALGETTLPVLGLYTVFPLGLLITAIPVAPAGVGTGHYAFAQLFKLISSERGADVFTLMAISNLFFGGLGGLVYLRFRAHDGGAGASAEPTHPPGTDPASGAPLPVA